MLDRRWGYLTFKLAAFAESQRRAMELSEARPEVQVHLITSDIKPNEQKTFYKCRQRRMSHLMRLYNNEADHIVLIVPNYMDLSEFIEEVQEMASTWKKPQIHVIHSVFFDLVRIQEAIHFKKQLIFTLGLHLKAQRELRQFANKKRRFSFLTESAIIYLK